MEFTKYERKPFQVEAVEITEENLEEIAKQVGTVKTRDDGVRYIQVNSKKVPSIYRVFPGYWMTKMGGKIRCYKPEIFADQFARIDG